MEKPGRPRVGITLQLRNGDIYVPGSRRGIADLMEVFGVGRATVYRVLNRAAPSTPSPAVPGPSPAGPFGDSPDSR
jgi:hypothetical protein